VLDLHQLPVAVVPSQATGGSQAGQSGCGTLHSVSRLPVTVIGIGADGWLGLTEAARDALHAAEVIFGGPRQLALLPAEITAERRPWPTPLVPALPGLIEGAERAAILASGDPMFFGIGATLVRLLGADAVRVITHPSSISLACARLGWPVEDVEVVSLVGRPAAMLHAALQPGRRVLVLVGESGGAATVAERLRSRGYGDSRLIVLEQLGGPAERVAPWTGGEHDPLAIVAFECRPDAGTVPLPRTPGLPDDAFDHDGQLTKREIRAITLAALAPVSGQLLWDVGAGSGSVGIEWMRAHPASRAVAIEPREDRRARIAANADALGVPALLVVAGAAPEALAGLPEPDAIFVGGGVSVPGVLDACLDALRPGRRLVANGVTVETETVLATAHAHHGGTLTRIAIQRAAPIGGFTGWAPARPVTQWAYRKEER